MIVNDLISLATAACAFGAAALGYVNHRRIGEVHDVVNGAADGQNTLVDTLTKQLTAQGISVPARVEPSELRTAVRQQADRVEQLRDAERNYGLSGDPPK